MTLPYIVGPPIKHPDDFYGRSKPIRRFFQILGGVQVQSLSILGVRRAGKTSFLHHIMNTKVYTQYLPDHERYLFVYMDVSFCKTPDEFYQRLFRQLAHVLREKLPIPITVRQNDQATLYDIEMLLVQAPACRFVLLLDEFDQLSNDGFQQEFLTELRALTSSWEYELACVTASYMDLYDIGASFSLPPTSPFYNIFYPTPIFLSGLIQSDSQAVIRRIERNGTVCRQEDETQIQKLAGSLPFFLQAVSAHWFSEETGRQSSGQRPFPHTPAYHNLANNLARYYSQWWRHFSAAEKNVLIDIVQGQNFQNKQHVGSEGALQQLMRYGLVVKREHDGLAVNGDVFANWILENAQNNEFTSPKNGTQPARDLINLRRVLTDSFSQEELYTLCFDLGVDFDELGGRNKSSNARNLIAYIQRLNRVEDLIDIIRQERGLII